MPTESQYPPVDIPNVDLWTFLFERDEREYPDDKVIYCDSGASRSYTYAQVRSTAIEFGQGLKDNWDWGKGDVLALYTPNDVDLPAVIWGCHWAGGVISPANPAYRAEELAFQLKDAGAKGLVTQKKFLDTAREACAAAGLSERRIILIGDDRDATRTFMHVTSMRNLSGVTRYRRARIDPKTDLAFLVYSSGTTGYPKGVMLTHTNIVSNILMLVVAEGNNLTWNGGMDGRGDRIIALLPFFHIYGEGSKPTIYGELDGADQFSSGLTCLVHQSLYLGLTSIVMTSFDIGAFCEAVQSFKATFAYVVPPVILLLAKHPAVERYDMSSLRMICSGAAPLAKELADAVYRRLKVPIKQAYGLSETSPTTHSQRWDEWNKAVGSVGRLLPNQTAKYISEDGSEVASGEVGELCIKGPNIFQGYLNNPKGTRDAFTSDGYLRTGDVGYQDRDGYFFITDRVKELIKYKGFQVAPAELEGLLATHPKVADAAVIGVYRADLASEVPRAYIVVAPDVAPSSRTETEILQWLQNQVANHKRLRGGLKFVQAIPRSVSGKILRRLLKIDAAKELAQFPAKL